MGAIDETGHQLIEPDYEPWRFVYNEAFVPARSNGKWGFIDWAGHIIEAQFDDVRPFERGIAWTKADGKWCPIDRRGGTIQALQCKTADPYPSQGKRSETWPCQIRP